MKHLRTLLILCSLGVVISLASCGDDEVTGTCAGCPTDAPWSVFGSDQCYDTQADCEAAESGDCQICN